MKVLFVGSLYNTDLRRIGGIENIIRELSRALALNNIFVKIMVIDNSCRGIDKINELYKNVYLVYASKNKVVKELYMDYDVINFLQTPFKNPLTFIRFLIHKKINNTITTKLFFTISSIKKYNVFNKIKLFFLIDKIIVFSKRLKYESEKISGKRIICLTPPVADYYFKSYKSRNKSNKKVLFAGRLSKDKGLQIVLKVFNELKKRGYFIGVWGYFSNKYDKNLYEEKLYNSGFDDVKITEQITADKEKYIRLCDYDMLLLPYQELGPTVDTPLLVLEGLAAGCKVVTSTIIELEGIKNLYKVDDIANEEDYIKMIESISNLPHYSNDLTYLTASSLAENYLGYIK